MALGGLTDVRFGSKADMCSAKGHVRFTPKSDIKCDMWNVRFGLIADIATYSITSSTRVSSDRGTVRPSALAVFRLIVRLYLVEPCTGRSAGFAPFSMRST